MATYLVTGGAGFIGSNIVDELVRRGETVRVLDNFSTGRRQNVAAFPETVVLIEGDIRDREAVTGAVKGCDYVVHQAALASVQRSVDNPTESNQVNVQGTLNLLEAARDNGVKRFVYASSSSVYGDSEVLPKIETMTPNPRSPYAITKLCGEWYCRVFSDIYELPTVSLRYFNVFGPRQDPNSQYSAVIPIFVAHLIAGTPSTIFGDGEQSRDFTYIDNVVRANLLACQSTRSGAQVYNVACGDRFTLNRLYAALSERLDSDVEAHFGPARTGDVRHSQAGIGEIEKGLGFAVAVTFDEGLDRTVRWYKEEGLAEL